MPQTCTAIRYYFNSKDEGYDMSTAVISEEQLCQLRSELSRCECPKCVEVRIRAIYRPANVSWRRGGKMAKQGCEWHESKTAIHWDWRDPDFPNHLILITCRECTHDSFVRKQVILRIWKGERCWKGLCSSCTGRMPMSGRFGDDEYKNPFGAKIDLKRPHRHNYRWVSCPNFVTCKGFEERRVDKYNIDTQPFHCKRCLSDTRRSTLSQLWFLKKSIGAGQRSGGVEKRSVGRPRRTPEADRQKLTILLSRIHEEVTRLRSEGRQRSNVTANEVAKHLGIGSHERGGTAMMQRATEWGLNSDWPTLRDFFWDGGQSAEVNFYPPNKN
jgi:hypothetical protein